MDQIWMIVPGHSYLDEGSLSLSYYYDESTWRIAVGSVWRPASGIDKIYVDSCDRVDCDFHQTHIVILGEGWASNSVISDVELVGTGDGLSLSFIGDNSTSSPPQVWIKPSGAFSEDEPLNISNSETIKMDLEMVRLYLPDNPLGLSAIPVMSWAETNFITMQYRLYDGFAMHTTVDDIDLNDLANHCEETSGYGDLAADGYNLAGVWDACRNTWFSSRASFMNLPLIKK
jgi:hypothetical protein